MPGTGPPQPCEMGGVEVPTIDTSDGGGHGSKLTAGRDRVSHPRAVRHARNGPNPAMLKWWGGGTYNRHLGRRWSWKQPDSKWG